MKKILIIIPIVIVILGAWFFLRDTTSITPTETLNPGSPFGSGEDINIPVVGVGETVGKTTTFDQPTAELKVFRISNTPVAGFVTFGRGTETVVRYVDRATGNIFDTTIPEKGNTNPVEKIRITNTTLPKIYEAYFRSDGSAVLLRSLKSDSDVIDNLTLALTAPKSTSTSEFYSVSATNLRGDIDSISVGAGNLLYYVLKDTGGIVSSTFTGTDIKTLFSSAFNNWRTARLGSGILLYPKASASTPGSAYTLSGSSLTNIAGPFKGLTALGSSDGKRILYSYFDSPTTKLFVKNISTKLSSEILPATLAEKCVWSTKVPSVFFCGTPITSISSNEPDNWYQGKSHFTDYIWRFDTDSEIAQLISEPKTTFNLDLDVSDPKLSSNESLMIFINKRDLTLWAVRLD